MSRSRFSCNINPTADGGVDRRSGNVPTLFCVMRGGVMEKLGEQKHKKAELLKKKKPSNKSSNIILWLCGLLDKCLLLNELTIWMDNGKEKDVVLSCKTYIQLS